MIDITKKYRTRDGKAITRLFEGKKTNPHDVYLIGGNIEGSNRTEWWTLDGYYYSPNSPNPYDLMEVEPEKKMIDITKHYRTRNGRVVVDLQVDNHPTFPIKARLGFNMLRWTLAGSYNSPGSYEHQYDLIEVPQEKDMPEIDFTKPVQTSHPGNPEPVQIITTEGRGTYPVVGYIGDSNKPTVWTANGRKQAGLITSEDLMNAPPPKQVRYVNIYGDGRETMAGMFRFNLTRAEADEKAQSTNRRTACIRIEYTEGQFDE